MSDKGKGKNVMDCHSSSPFPVLKAWALHAFGQIIDHRGDVDHAKKFDEEVSVQAARLSEIYSTFTLSDNELKICPATSCKESTKPGERVPFLEINPKIGGPQSPTPAVGAPGKSDFIPAMKLVHFAVRLTKQHWREYAAQLLPLLRYEIGGQVFPKFEYWAQVDGRYLARWVHRSERTKAEKGEACLQVAAFVERSQEILNLFVKKKSKKTFQKVK